MSQYVYNKHNTTWKVLCTVFTHSLFLYQKSYSFAALTLSISDTSTTRALIPYASTFHEVFSISTRIRIFLKTDIFSPLSKNTLPHVAYLNNFRTSTRKRLNNETFCYPVWHEQQRPGTGASHGFTHIENRAGAVGRDGLVH